MKKKVFLLLVFVLFLVPFVGKTQNQHTFRNQLEKNVLIELENGVRQYLGAVNSSSNTSSHVFYDSCVSVRVTVDYQAPVNVTIDLNNEFIDINKELLSDDNITSTQGISSSSAVNNQEKENKSLKSVLFINTTDYKIVGRTAPVKGLTLMPGDSIDGAVINLNNAVRYNLFESTYLDGNNTVLKKENVNKLLNIYNSSAKTRWLNQGSYETNWKVYLTEAGQRDKIGALLILQFKVDDKTDHIIINQEEVDENLPHGKKKKRDIINKSDKKIQLTIGGTQKVVSAKKGRRFNKVRMEEDLANGYYYLTVSLLSDKAIQRDLLLLISQEQRHFVINQNDVDQITKSHFTGQGIQY